MTTLRTLTAGLVFGLFLCSLVVGAMAFEAEDAIDRALRSRHG